MTSLEEAKQRGRHDCAIGVNHSWNPYTRETLRRAWLDAWYESDKEQIREHAMRNLEITLRGQRVIITNASAAEADPDAGLPDRTSYTLRDSDGNDLGWRESLSTDEIRIIDETIWSAIEDPSSIQDPTELTFS